MSEADVAEQGLPATDDDEMYLRDKEGDVYLAAFITRTCRMDVDNMDVALVIFDTDSKWKEDKGTVEIEYCHMVDGVRQKYRGTPMIQGNTYFFSVFTREKPSVMLACSHIQDYLHYKDALKCAQRLVESGRYKLVDNTKAWRKP